MLQIAQIPVEPRVVLAPMEGVTDRAFRTLIRSLGGVGLAVTEFVSSEGLTREVESAWRMAELDPDEHPVSIQIYGRDPARMAQAARHCESLGADIVDINLGCPSKRVTSGCSGSALMKEPELARDIFHAVRDAITVPMTVKMRLGWCDANLNAPEIAARAEEAGASMVAVHGRTRNQGYKGSARWDEVGAVRRAVSIPLLVNGDIVDPATARAALAASGADGVMVGRAVMHDPWALRRIADDVAGVPFREPTLEERHAVLQAYLDRVTTEHGGEVDRRTAGKVKQVIAYFTKHLHNCRALRHEINRIRTVDDARRLVEAFFRATIAEDREATLQLHELVAARA
ncbi:MAG: tRNA dihydrouridine synthase DusB [Deltaproteobacteria bacterium]|nr:MAG: tRNA dihydrouridine synthase DusB [Deltaproteobacteria bacterium]